EKNAFRDLSQILQRKIELEPDETAKRALRFELARVYEHDLKDGFAAIDAYKGALVTNARDREALTELARLYESEKLWIDHLEMLDALAQLLPVGERSALELRAADVVAEKQGDVEAAITRYRDLLNSDAAQGTEAHARARAALERMVRDERTR